MESVGQTGLGEEIAGGAEVGTSVCVSVIVVGVVLVSVSVRVVVR